MIRQPITIAVKHTIQMGHRLWALPGKCQQLHGHTWKIVLSIQGETDEHGILIEYAELKRRWRGYLDEYFDHHLCLHSKDPLIARLPATQRDFYYPGYVEVSFQPTVENLAAHWAAQAVTMFGQHYKYTVELWEGDNNCAIASVE